MAYLLAGWNTARVPMGFADLDDNIAGAAFPTGAFVLASAKYAHVDLSSVMGSGLYDDFATALAAIMNSTHTGPGSVFTVAWSSSTLSYTIGSSSDVYLDFRSTPGRNLAAALGFNYLHDDATGGSAGDPYNVLIATTVAVSNVVPYYALALDRDGVSAFRRPYEVSGQTKRQVSVNGSAYSVGPLTREERFDASIRFQSLETVWTSEADDSVAPWTYEALVKHVRCHEPVLLHTPTLDLIGKRIDGEWSNTEHRPEFGDYHGNWQIDMKMQHLGEL